MSRPAALELPEAKHSGKTLAARLDGGGRKISMPKVSPSFRNF